MKISIIGAGNMGGAIALGLVSSKQIAPEDISIINSSKAKIDALKAIDNRINAVVNDYRSLETADVVILAVKPWLVESVLTTLKQELSTPKIIISIAAGISLEQLKSWTSPQAHLFRVMPNTAISIQQSMSFIASINASEKENETVLNLFEALGKAELIDEKLFSAATALASCGIAYAFRYIRAAMEGGIEMGFYPQQAKDAVIQTLRGAIDLLEANDSHPETEIDKVTTAGGITIKGLNEMEHAGFTSSIIRGLKASNVK